MERSIVEDTGNTAAEMDAVITDEVGGRYVVITEASARHVKTYRAARERAIAHGTEIWVE
jgi:hypothetical protein